MMARPKPLPEMPLVFPRSIFKVTIFCAFIGLLAGGSYFIIAAGSMVDSSPVGMMWVMLSSVGCGLFASLALAWAWMACLNRRSRKLLAFFLGITLLLGSVFLSFWSRLPVP